MVFVLMTPDLDGRAAFFDPLRALATVHVDQPPDIPDAIAFCNDSRLGKDALRERDDRTGSLCHGLRLTVRCFCSKPTPLYLPLMAALTYHSTPFGGSEPR